MNGSDRREKSVDEQNSFVVKRGVWYDHLAIEFGDFDERGQHIAITARLRASENGAHSPLLLDLAYCPLVIGDISCSLASLTVERMPRPGKAPMIGLVLDPPPNGGWDGLSIVFSVHWTPDNPVLHGARTKDSRGILAPCLVLPEAMPSIHAVGDAFGSHEDDVLVRLSVSHALPNHIVAGGIHTEDGASWLQLVFGINTSVAVAGVTDMVLLAPDYDTSTLRGATGQLEAVRTFLDEILGARNLTHVLFVSDEGANPFYAPAGAYSSVPPRWLGLPAGDMMNDTAIARTLAYGWVGGGTRLWGENSVELALGVAAAYGLLWLAHKRGAEAIDRALDSYARIAKLSYDTETRKSGNQAIAMALPIFRALDTTGVRKDMTNIIADHWGRLLPQRRLIELLRSHGVALPHVFM